MRPAPASPAVSRRHCVLTVESDRVRLQDLGGANGTLVNDVHIDRAHELVSGDRIRIGPLEFQALFAAPVKPSQTQPSGSPPSEIVPPSGTPPGSETPQSAPAVPPAGEAPAPGGNADDDIMQWLTDVPGKERKSIYLSLDAERQDASGSDTGQISLDGTQPISWPESPPVAATLPPSASVSELLKAGKPGSKRPDPNAAGNTRDAAKAAIDMFRHRNDK